GHLAVEVHVAARLAGLGVAHVAMHDRGTRLRRRDRGLGDLLGRTRYVRAAVLRATGAGDGAGDEDLAVHRKRHGCSSLATATRCPSRAVTSVTALPVLHGRE